MEVATTELFHKTKNEIIVKMDGEEVEQVKENDNYALGKRNKKNE
jgi:hypothetical protein